MKTENRFMFGVLALFGVVNLVDFMVFERKLGVLLLSIGFVLLGYSLYKDKAQLSLLPLLAGSMVMAGFIVKWFFDVVLF